MCYIFEDKSRGFKDIKFDTRSRPHKDPSPPSSPEKSSVFLTEADILVMKSKLNTTMCNMCADNKLIKPVMTFMTCMAQKLLCRNGNILKKWGASHRSL